MFGWFQSFIGDHKVVKLVTDLLSFFHNLRTFLYELFEIKVISELPGHKIDLLILLLLLLSIFLKQYDVLQAIDIRKELLMRIGFILQDIIEFVLNFLDLLVHSLPVVNHVDVLAEYLIFSLPIYFLQPHDAKRQRLNVGLNHEEYFGRVLSYLLR